MKKTFFYVMMAATALFTTTMTSCSDDDDDKKNNETEEAMIDDINQSILNNFVVLDDDNNLARRGMYGCVKDAADSTSFICQVADAAAAVTFFNELMPDTLVNKVVVNGQKRTLSYTQEGKQYTMTYAPATDENIATITLPNVDGYNKYARTVQLRDHVSNNAMTKDQFQEQYVVGWTYSLSGVEMPVTNNNNEETRLYYTKTENYLVEDARSPQFICFKNDGNIAYFAYFPSFAGLKDRTDFVIDKYLYIDGYSKDEYNVNYRLYPCHTLSTDECYLGSKNGGYNACLPTPKELKLFQNELEHLYDRFIEINPDLEDKKNNVEEPGYLKTIFGNTGGMNNYMFATNETKNGMFIRKQVKYLKMITGADDDVVWDNQGFGWAEKHHNVYLNAMYITYVVNM